MSAASPWPVIHAERAALADDLSSLDQDRWATPSLGAGWSVHDVLGHLTATAKTTPGGFLAKFARSGFRFDAMAGKDVVAETAGGPAATLAEFRRVLDATTAPPGPVESWLGETILHAEDIRRPLGVRHVYPPSALVRLAEFYKGSNLLIGAKRRIAGMTLKATDTGWWTGSGPEVSGPMLSLLLAMTGRAVAVDDLTGDGLATLRSRLAEGGRPA
jgi:uncharacterized protein (TIGR03083 family)